MADVLKINYHHPLNYQAKGLIQDNNSSSKAFKPQQLSSSDECSWEFYIDIRRWSTHTDNGGYSFLFPVKQASTYMEMKSLHIAINTRKIIAIFPNGYNATHNNYYTFYNDLLKLGLNHIVVTVIGLNIKVYINNVNSLLLLNNGAGPNSNWIYPVVATPYETFLNVGSNILENGDYRFIHARIFNYALTDADVAYLWNNGECREKLGSEWYTNNILIDRYTKYANQDLDTNNLIFDGMKCSKILPSSKGRLRSLGYHVEYESKTPITTNKFKLTYYVNTPIPFKDMTQSRMYATNMFIFPNNRVTELARLNNSINKWEKVELRWTDLNGPKLSNYTQSHAPGIYFNVFTTYFEIDNVNTFYYHSDDVTLVQLGCIAEYIPENLSPYMWKDSSGQSKHLIPTSGTIDVYFEDVKNNRDTTGSGAPTMIPTKVGQKYTDTTNNRIYTAVGTSSTADWI